MSWISEARSLGDMFKRNCGRYAQKTCYLRPDKSGHQPVTYAEALEAVFAYARALDSFGLQKGDTVALVCETRVEWAMTDWACQTLGLVLVPVYPTLPADQAQYIVTDSAAKLVVAQDEKQAAKFQGVAVVKLFGEDSLLSHDSGLSREAWDARTAAVDQADVATIIYTSGTTGQPKGAMLMHAGFIDLSDAVHVTYAIDENDTFLSFLPLSHVFERYAGHVLPISVGATTAYVGSLASLANDLQTVKPTIMCAVPRFFENLRLRIIDGIEKQSPFNQRMFHWALRQGALRFAKRPAPFFWLTDRLVGTKIRARMGGRMRFFVSGGAALSPHVSEFYIAFGVTILQGYGLTENTAATCLNLPEDNRPWTVGPPITCVEVKIAPDGEILTRGTSNMKGYLNLPEATAEAIDAEGWFHTGDIGEFEGPNLKITDRKKDILVLANGKNIAPLKIEAKLKESEYIAEAVVFGDGLEHCVALIVPEFERVKVWLKSHDLASDGPEQTAAMDEVRALVKEGVDQANRQLADFERVKKHVVIGTVFSVDTGELTPSLKVRRRFVKEKYKDALVGLLKNS